MRLTLTINNPPRQDEVEPRMLLVHYLRDVAGLTRTQVGCETSLCGARTVLVDGNAVKSCTMLAVQADGAKVATVEGRAREGGRECAQRQSAGCQVARGRGRARGRRYRSTLRHTCFG
jgi:aerobic carbon-monoxide dehydrogenase small subunit